MHSLKKMIAEADPSVKVVDYIIRNKHKYIILKSEEYNGSFLIPVSNYKECFYANGAYTIVTKNPMKFDGLDYEQATFDVDMMNPNVDIYGFESMEEISKVYDVSTLNCVERPKFKLIFSPLVAKYLLKKNYKIVDLKKRRDDSDECIFVFLVEDGFFDAINKFAANK